jgi:hypothetical protein
MKYKSKMEFQEKLDTESIYGKSIDAIKRLIEKYKTNEYMLQRIQNHVVQNLPTTLETEAAAYEKRRSRVDHLTKEQQLFIQVFLSKNK